MEKIRWLLVGGLSATHLIWAVALFADPIWFVRKISQPYAAGILHLASAALIVSRFRVAGLFLSSTVLAFYWAFVKPFEPLAEPQSVGILAISVSELLRTLFSENFFTRILLRGGLAYPFFEWGLDALRNPYHFAAYLSANKVAAPLFQIIPLYPAIYVLGLYEIVLSLWIVSGLGFRHACLVTVLTLLIFSTVAGYPLALPQNIALMAAAAAHLTRSSSSS